MGNKISKGNIFLTYPTSVIACPVAIFCAFLTSVNCFNVEISFFPFISLIITYSVTGGKKLKRKGNLKASVTILIIAQNNLEK